MILPERISSTAHYDEIPTKCLGQYILDIGSSDCYGAAHSRHRDYFFSRSCDYLGIEIQNFESTYLPVITADILSFEPGRRFDSIFLLHVLEHFDIEQWPNLFDKINSLLVPGGWIVVNVPYQGEKYKDVCGAMDHKVGKIDEEMLFQYWPFQEFIKIDNSNSPKIQIMLRSKGENLLWVFGRFIYRIITNHKHSVIRRFIKYRGPVRIVAIYQKELDC